jgi:outer membrane protein TolC
MMKDFTPEPIRSQKIEPAEEIDLGKKLDINQLIELAMQRNPELTALREKASAILAEARADSKLKDLSFSFEMNRLPVKEPWRFDRVDMYMFSLTQEFQTASTLEAKSKVQVKKAAVVYQEYRMARAELVMKLQSAYAEYFVKLKEKGLREIEKQVIQELKEIAIAHYGVGSGTQTDVLQMETEKMMVENRLIELDQEISTLQSSINSIIARDPAAPLPPPMELAVFRQSMDEKKVIDAVYKSRPETSLMQGKINQQNARVTWMQKEARLPEFMVSLGYQYSPMMTDGFYAMLSMSLPWLNPKHSDEIDMARSEVKMAQSEYDSELLKAKDEVWHILLKIRADQLSIDKFEKELLPVAEQTFSAAKVEYEKSAGNYLNVLEALRRNYTTKIEYFMLVGDLAMQLADLQRSSGVDIDQLTQSN